MRGQKILLLSTNADLYQQLAGCLSSRPLDVEAWHTLGDILRKLTTENVRLVLLDAACKEEPPVQAVMKIKALHPHPPLVVIIPAADAALAVACLRAGADHCLGIPLDSRHVQKIIDDPGPLLGTSCSDQPSGVESMPSGNAIGRYRIIEKLGEGAKGAVYLAEDESGDDPRRYALKILKLHALTASESADAVERFMHEGEAALQVEHQNVVRVVDYSVARDRNAAYMVMEHFPGRDLSTIIAEQSPLSCADGIHIILQIAAGLEAIHGHDICHRDIKPENILVDADNRVKITDFGIAQLPNSDLTMVHDFLGTPCYMSPEGFNSPKVDGRADIFSLGVLAYELLVGRHPFRGKNVSDLEYRVRIGLPEEPRKISPDFPMPVQAILGRMLKKHPRDRYQTTTELIVDLRACLSAPDEEPSAGNGGKGKSKQVDWN